MDHTLLYLSENFLNAVRGALLMLYIIMCIRLNSERKENPILASLFWLVTAMSVLLVISLCFMVEELKSSEYFRALKILINVCFVPLAGGFLLEILVPDRINLRKGLLLSVPTVAFFVIYAITENGVMITLSLGYTTFLLIAMIVLIVYISLRYDRYLKNNFSNIDNMSVRWVRMVVYLCAVWYLIWRFMIKQDGYLPEALYYLFLIFVWSYIYKYSIMHITAIRTNELFEPAGQVATATSEPESATRDRLVSNLESYMSRKAWLNPSLTLQDMASALGTNRTYLSEYFNNTLDTTFYDYLNSFRIKHACEILLSDFRLPISQVGEKSGFNSLSTFRRTFEKHTGYSPAKYRSRNINI